MDSLIHPHWEALTPSTRQALTRICHLDFMDDFYLAGGTGLALHLGHRFSIDLDFFSPHASSVGPEQRDALRALLTDPSLVVAYDSDGTFVAS